MVQIEIWSDVVCPFCYIGKRHLETALSGFEHRDQVRIQWKSFELDPSAERNPSLSLNELLSRKYGRSLEWARQAHAQMTEQARGIGLDYRFDQVKPTNSFDAHRLIHLAAAHGRQDQAEERLFQAYYTRGEHIGDPSALQRIGVELGLDPDQVLAMLQGDAFSSEVRSDEEEAGSLGISGVPFFLFNKKYAVSGAQPVEVFARALRTAWDDQGSWPKGDAGPTCGPAGCEIS